MAITHSELLRKIQYVTHDADAKLYFEMLVNGWYKPDPVYAEQKKEMYTITVTCGICGKETHIEDDDYWQLSLKRDKVVYCTGVIKGKLSSFRKKIDICSKDCYGRYVVMCEEHALKQLERIEEKYLSEYFLNQRNFLRQKINKGDI